MLALRNCLSHGDKWVLALQHTTCKHVNTFVSCWIDISVADVSEASSRWPMHWILLQQFATTMKCYFPVHPNNGEITVRTCYWYGGCWPELLWLKWPTVLMYNKKSADWTSLAEMADCSDVQKYMSRLTNKLEIWCCKSWSEAERKQMRTLPDTARHKQQVLRWACSVNADKTETPVIIWTYETDSLQPCIDFKKV